MDTTTERNLNLAAAFLPMQPDQPGTLPCIQVAGVQVYTYIECGELIVSLHYDTADEYLLDTRACVPTRVVAGGTEVWSA